MSTDDLVKSVARKLKYYFEVKRLEDGFDLCDLHQPTHNHSPTKTKPAHKHDALHDKTLKQYFSDPDVRSMLKQLNNYDTRGALQGWREIEVRKMLDNYMKHYSFQKPTVPSYYVHHNHRKKPTSAGVILYRRKQKQNNLLRSWPVKQTLSDQHISKGEAERLVNSATKIICGSELSSLGKISFTHKQGGRQSASALSQSELSRPTTARSWSTLQYRDKNEKKGQTPRSPRAQKRQKSKQPHSRSTSPAQSSRSSSTSSRTSSSYSRSSSSSGSSSRHSYQSHTSSPASKHSPRKNESPAVINLPVQKQQTHVGIERSTQTEEDGSVNKRMSEPKTANSDNLREVSDDRTPCEYQVLVRTGDRLGSGTAAPVKLTLFGDKGRSEEYDLSKMSMRHKIPFQKGNEDLFLLPGCHIGQLRKIQIGHEKAQINYAWFLENVAVYNMHTKRVYQFPCQQWLSGQDRDKKTYRILEADSERNFTEAPDTSITRSVHKQKNSSRPDLSSEEAHKSQTTSAHAKPQDDHQNSATVISSNVRMENDSVRFQEGGTTQRGKKDDYEQKATKITLRSMPDSKIVDEIILENCTNMDTSGKSGNDSMDSYKKGKSSSDSENGSKNRKNSN